MRNIKTKTPWRVVRPDGALRNKSFVGTDTPLYEYRSQADFVREYYPSGHKIHSTLHYPNIFREVTEEILDADGNPTGKSRKLYYEEMVPRYAFAFQQIIATKQLVHLCGNDVQFDLLNKENKDHLRILEQFRDGWAEKDMETAFYSLARSVKITGDGAIVCYREDGAFSWRSLSFLDDDKLYPHYDRNGNLCLFARAFSDYEDDGETKADFLEVWDAQNYYLLKSGEDSTQEITFCRGRIGIQGYELIEKAPHGFPRIPVVYYRDKDGACWSNSQDSIDMYEISFSQMAQNNKSFGEPIMWLRGDNIDCIPDQNGTIKTLTMGTGDEAGYLPAQSASESYHKQLDLTYKLIYEQSFAVIPPELKSGDLPAAALKILYSPAYEKASIDCLDYQAPLSELVYLFMIGYGMECKCTIDFQNIPLKWWLKPYVHVNWSTTISDLMNAVNSGFLSKQTASERISEYSTPKEWARIQEELQTKLTQELEAKIAERKATADTQTSPKPKTE